jgi:hypothetical protein
MRKGLLKVGWLAGGLALACGCEHYRNLVDPCWPERYTYAARHNLNEAFATQAYNGHVLDQTVWNYHFEPGKDVLTPGGLEHLAYLARRRPAPDAVVYLQTAQDIPYDQAAPDRFVEQRNTLDQRRAEVIRKYLLAQTANRPVDFQVVVHDPAEPGQAATPVGFAINGPIQGQNRGPGSMYGGSIGVLPTTAGAGGSPQGGAGR